VTTPEPVSPAPDTEALRAYLRRTIGGDFERRLIAADLVDDDDALSVLRVFEDVVPAIEREITSRHEAFVLMLADAKAERDERIAGLRADLDRARRERDKLADLHRGEARTHDETIASLNAVRAEREAWSSVARGLARRVSAGRAAASEMIDRHLHSMNILRAECEELHASARRARSAGARTIPDDAAERLARWLFRMNGRRQGEPPYGDGAASPERQEKRWNTWLEDEDRDRLREMARHVLADLGVTLAVAGSGPGVTG
jgi:hypothetical protein